MPQPQAFMSYAHIDDRHRRLTQFRRELSDEVRVHLGREFSIFQDWNDIGWGQNWKARIQQSLEQEAIFLIPILSPSFFNSEPCQAELRAFLDKETNLGRDDLVLPVYYVDCPLLYDQTALANNDLARTIATRQSADWRELRTKYFNTPVVMNALVALAKKIRDALARVRAQN
jgi:TIR domain